jgi:hypothetical protein
MGHRIQLIGNACAFLNPAGCGNNMLHRKYIYSCGLNVLLDRFCYSTVYFFSVCNLVYFS